MREPLSVVTTTLSGSRMNCMFVTMITHEYEWLCNGPVRYQRAHSIYPRPRRSNLNPKP